MKNLKMVSTLLPNKLMIKKVMYYGMTLFFFLGILGGFRSYFLKQEDLYLADGTSYVESYLKEVFTKSKDENGQQKRKEFLTDNSFDFVEILNDKITVSVVTDIQKKREETLINQTDFVKKEYIYIINYAYRLDAKETMYGQETIKLLLAYDVASKSYIVERLTAYDYGYRTDVSDQVKKRIGDDKKAKRELKGDALDEIEKKSIMTQLTLFFKTYSEDQANAQSLVATSVELPILTGEFDTSKLELLRATSKDDKIQLIIKIDYYNKDKSLEYKKEYKIVMVDKTITEMEEI